MWGEWRASRERKLRAERYLGTVLRDPPEAELQWLQTLGVSNQRAVRELGFCRRAVGLIVAERDALDDRTAADVAHLLAPVMAGESRRDPEYGAAWPERWRAYAAALAVRGSAEAPAVRLARVMLAGLGMPEPTPEVLQHATRYVMETRSQCNESLRAAYGEATLPEDVKPSTLAH
jgi:hypothetical protein